jgi:hypothetical protein
VVDSSASSSQAQNDAAEGAFPAHRMAQTYLQSVDLGQHVMLQELLRALPLDERMECADA